MMKYKINPYYKDAYEKFYHIENILRISIHHHLISKYGTGYFNEKNFPKYRDKHVAPDKEINLVKHINNKYALNLKKNKNIHHIFYFDYGILLSFIKKFWDTHELNNIFKIDCKNILEILTPLINYRNDIAHNRPYNQEIAHEIIVVLQKISSNIQTKYLNIYEQYIQTTINSENCLIETQKIILEICESLEREEVIGVNDFNKLFNHYNSLCLINKNNHNSELTKLFHNIKKDKKIEQYNKFRNIKSDKFYPSKKDLKENVLRIKDFLYDK